MKILFVIRTYYSLMVATNLKITEFKNDDVDILLTDCMSDSKNVYENIKKSKIFRNVFFVKMKDFKDKSAKKSLISKLKILKMHYIFLKKSVPFFVEKTNITQAYDRLFVFQVNIDLELCAFNYCYKMNNKIELCLYEESYLSYIAGKNELKIYEKDTIDKLSILLRLPQMRKAIKYGYYFCPDLLCYRPYFKICKIKKFDENKDSLTKIFNEFWNYTPQKFKGKVIYCEDSYYIDGDDIGDDAIVFELNKRLKEGDFFVKLHPRSNQNRFYKNEIAILENNNIPLELVLLNMDKEVVFLSLYSSSIISVTLCFEMQHKAYFLFPCSKKKKEVLEKRLKKFLEKFNASCQILNEISDVLKLVDGD